MLSNGERKPVGQELEWVIDNEGVGDVPVLASTTRGVAVERESEMTLLARRKSVRSSEQLALRKSERRSHEAIRRDRAAERARDMCTSEPPTSHLLNRGRKE